MSANFGQDLHAVAAVSPQINVSAKSLLPGARGQVEAGGKPAEVHVGGEVDAHPSVAKFSSTPGVHAIAYFDQRSFIS